MSNGRNKDYTPDELINELLISLIGQMKMTLNKKKCLRRWI